MFQLASFCRNNFIRTSIKKNHFSKRKYLICCPKTSEISPDLFNCIKKKKFLFSPDLALCIFRNREVRPTKHLFICQESSTWIVFPISFAELCGNILYRHYKRVIYFLFSGGIDSLWSPHIKCIHPRI